MKCICLSTFALMMLFASSAPAQTSLLWGDPANPTWNPNNSRLADFTNVGYKGGDEPIPDWPVAHSVTDFGAVADDNIDDSQAFIDAIAACPDYQSVLVPKGKFTIAQKIEITNDYVCLRGEDMYKSVLFFPKYYGEVYIQEIGFGPGQTPVYSKFIQLLGGSGKSFENLTFKFREQRNKGAWEYEGAGFIDYKSNVADSWIRNCVFLNFSSAMTVSATRTSFINLIFDQFNGRQGTDDAATKTIDGYGCILVRNCSYNLFHNISIKSDGHYLQPIDLNESSSYNVYSQYRGNEQLNRAIGYHGGSSRYNLYTDMDLGVVRPREGPSRSDETYWNVNDNYLHSEVWEEVYNGSNDLIFVGYGDQWPAKTNDPALWYEPAEYGTITPANLYLAQLDFFNEPLPEALPGPAPSRYAGDVFGVVPEENTKVDGNWYYRFDLSDADLSSVARARLRVHLDNRRISTPPYTFRAWSVTDDAWSEDSITSANKPTLVSQLDDRWFAHVDDDRVLEFDVTAFVQGELVGGDGVVSLALDIPEPGKSPNLWSANRGTKPELIIERVPDPVAGPPSAPKNIGTTPLIGNILLDWEDHPESDVTYTVYRNPYKVEADGTYTDGYGEYIDNGLVTSDVADIQSTTNWRPGRMYDGVVYKYRISAVDAHGYESPRSKEIYAATLHPTNSPPVFADPISLADATAGAAYSESLAVHASDPESDQLYFHIVSGPEWLEVSADGVLSGSPLWSDAGVYAVTFQVTAIGGSTQKTVDVEVVLPPDNPPGAPSTPTGLTATTGENSIVLNWDDNSEADFNAYTVYRSTTSGSGYTELTDRQTSSDFVDNTTVNDVTYYYVVSAVDSNGNESIISGEASAFSVSDLTPPGVPAGLSAIPTADSILLRWDDNMEGDLAGYSIYRSTTSGDNGSLLAAGVSASSYSDTDVVDGVTYYYTVTSTDDSGNESASSIEVVGTYSTDVKTVWLGSASDDIWDSVHWSDGLPDSSTNEGSLASDARWDAATATLVDYYLNITGGTLTGSSFTIFFTFDGGQQTLNGGSIDTSGRTLKFNSGAVGSMDNANSSITASRVFLDNASLTLNNGTLTANQLYFNGSGAFTMNGGNAVFTTGDAFLGAQSFGGGSVSLNGGSLTAGNLIFASAWDLTLGGTTTGTAEFTAGFGGTNHNDSLININWLPGSKMDLIVAGADWAAIWNDGRMTYDGQDHTTLGPWSVVTATDGLGSDIRFDYDGASETLSISAGPPPDTTPPAAPISLQAESGDGEVSLSWADNVEVDLAGYSVYRSTTSGSYGMALASSLGSSAYVDSTVVNDTTYYYVVTASDSSGNESAASSEVSATPTAPVSNTLIGGDIGVAANWGDGVVPSDPADPGIIDSENTGANRATIPDTSARTGLAILQTGGELAFTGFGTSIFDDVDYEITGGTFTSTIFGHRIRNGSVFDINGGNVNINSFGLESSSVLNVESGSMTLSGDLTSKASVLNFSGGTVSVGGNVIGSFNNGTLNFSGNALFNVAGQFGYAHFATASTVNIGAGDGSISVDTLEADSMTINWVSGSGFTFTADSILSNGVVATWADIWNAGQMTYAGNDVAALGDWSVVSSSGFGDGYAFVYNAATGALSVGIPAGDTTAPASPSALSASAGIGQVTLDWSDNNESDLASYTVYRSTTAGSGYSFLASVTSSDYIDVSVADNTTYYYVVTASDAVPNESGYSNEASAMPGLVTALPDNEIAVAGSVSGTLADVGVSDNAYQSITEIDNGTTSILEHVWAFNVTGAEVVTFYVEAYHTANGEGDDFVFAYSLDDVNYTEMLTVTKTSDDNTAQFYTLPSGLSGTVYIRVHDADGTPGHTQLDTIYIDELVIESEVSSLPPTTAAIPSPVDGAQGVSVDSDLSWTAGLYAASHDVYFGTDPSPAFQGNQSGTSYDPGPLLEATTYYWSITEVNNTGATAGDIWSFTTEDSLAPDVLHWAFDEGSGSSAGDGSGNSRDGSVSGAAWTTETPDGSAYALDFAGGSFVEDIDAGNYLNGLAAITVAMWVKSDTTNTDNGYFSTNNLNGQDNQLAGRYDKDGWAGGGTNVIKTSLSTTGGVSVLESASNIQTTSWQHLTMTWSSGGSLKLYVDGVETTYTDAPASVSGAINNVATLVIGKGTKDGGGSKGWSGLIDDVRIYSSELTAAEIQTLAQ